MLRDLPTRAIESRPQARLWRHSPVSAASHQRLRTLQLQALQATAGIRLAHATCRSQLTWPSTAQVTIPMALRNVGQMLKRHLAGDAPTLERSRADQTGSLSTKRTDLPMLLIRRCPIEHWGSWFLFWPTGSIAEMGDTIEKLFFGGCLPDKTGKNARQLCRGEEADNAFSARCVAP
jgi:hypothetical protein